MTPRALLQLLLATLLLFGSAIEAAAADSKTSSTSSDKNILYVIARGDRLRIAVFQEEDLSSLPRVDANGSVNLPLIGDIRVAGLTITAAQKSIESSFRQNEYLRYPQVTITVEEYAPREISILGQVRNPGKFTLPIESSLTVVEAITRAGGFTDIAKGTAVRITRTQPDGSEETFELNIERIIRGQGSKNAGDNSMLLQPGDIIFVPERLI